MAINLWFVDDRHPTTLPAIAIPTRPPIWRDVVRGTLE